MDGNRVHVVERGAGSPVVLIHGNGSLAQGWPAPGVVDRLAAHHPMLIVERPGCGYTISPRERIWTPSAQARLIRGALDRPGVGLAAIFGHSWGTLVTLAHAHALDHPEQTRSITLLSAY
jgi:pimeloyl-ACP methyl ester carboxylesterase